MGRKNTKALKRDYADAILHAINVNSKTYQYTFMFKDLQKLNLDTLVFLAQGARDVKARALRKSQTH